MAADDTDTPGTTGSGAPRSGTPGAKLQAWFAGRLPDGWFTGPPTVVYDRDEIVVSGELAEPDAGATADDAARATARAARIQGFREDTRALRMQERRVLDTLVDAGVARSRSHALAWCVRLVSEHEGDWIDQLREALVHVEKVRDEGPTPRA